MKNTEKIMHSITKRSDLILLFFAILSFAILGTFKAEYYNTIFGLRFPPKIALLIGVSTALLIEGTRFALMLSSAEDARQGKGGTMFLGILASIGLLFYDISICNEIGKNWSIENQSTYINILQFVAVLGGVLEFRLCLLMKAAPQEQDQPQASDQHTATQQAAQQPPAHSSTTQGIKIQTPPPYPFVNSSRVPTT